MTFYSSNQFGRRGVRFSSGGGIGCLIFGVLGLVAAYYILKGMFYLLLWASPVLFALALIINWRAVADTLKNWLKSMETNPLGGLLMAALAVLAFPFFAFYLFVKSLGYRKVEQMRREFGGQPGQTREDQFTEFEELESRPMGDLKTDEPLEPPVLPEEKPERSRATEPKKTENPYDKLFD